MRYLLAGLLHLSLLNVSRAQTINTGQWRGLISYSQADVPFVFDVQIDDESKHIITLKNGTESIVIANTRWEADSLIIPMHVFDAEIIAKVSNETMVGYWVKHYKKNARAPFTAAFNQPRFDGSETSEKITKVPEKLKMTMMPEYSMIYETLGLFKQSGSIITGTIMAEIGDFRYFAGIVKGDSILASSFDGVHAFLLKGHFDGQKWQGEFVMDNNYAESWTGIVDPNFDLTDPFVATDPSDPTKLEPYFDILTAGSGFNSLNKNDFLGQVTIIQLMGSWCPNSLDETNYLTQWYKENHDRGVEVLAVFFEMNYSKEYGLQRMNDYVAQNNIPYATALGGQANKGQAALAFPFINKLDAFPTLMILDKASRVRYMHTYFQGPATGDYYKAFDKRFNEIVEELLRE